MTICWMLCMYPAEYFCPDAPTSLSWTICSRIALTFQCSGGADLILHPLGGQQIVLQGGDGDAAHLGGHRVSSAGRHGARPVGHRRRNTRCCHRGRGALPAYHPPRGRQDDQQRDSGGHDGGDARCRAVSAVPVLWGRQAIFCSHGHRPPVQGKPPREGQTASRGGDSPGIPPSRCVWSFAIHAAPGRRAPARPSRIRRYVPVDVRNAVAPWSTMDAACGAADGMSRMYWRP